MRGEGEKPHQCAAIGVDRVYGKKSWAEENKTRMNATTNGGERNSSEKGNEEQTENMGKLTVVTKDGRVIIETNHG